MNVLQRAFERVRQPPEPARVASTSGVSIIEQTRSSRLRIVGGPTPSSAPTAARPRVRVIGRQAGLTIRRSF